MSTRHRGVFVTIDGPGGAGKTTTTAHLHNHLTANGYAVYATTEPSRAPLGVLARDGNRHYIGHALACLIAADRYHHLATEIRTHLAQGCIVVCDRYVASSYVLQRLDGVPIEFIDAINADADRPDLAVILTAKPEVTAERIKRRGSHSRFETGITTSQAEANLYRDTMARLSDRGYPLLSIDTTKTPTEAITARIAERIANLAALPQLS